uniref:Latent transforming growth factor beta binding protein 4 n=1 Tax=Xiphophorus couchianus TaxID=32473 RepID=A0A3B5M283_9TELE
MRSSHFPECLALRRVACVSTELLFVLLPDENLSVCWQHVSADLLCQSPLLGAQVTFIDCCCFYGEGWGMGCALCPRTDSGKRRAAAAAGGLRHANDGSAPRTPTFRLPADPRSDIAFVPRPLPPSRSDPPPLSLAPRPGPPYGDQEEGGGFRGWRPGAGLPPFTDRGGGEGGGPRRVYESKFVLPGRYETHASLSATEDCGILHGCENGQCIRVAEGYTCDCYVGFELDLTSMSCIDINECEDAAALPFPCVNARCVNTEGSFRCVCRRGYVMSRRRNHCIAA